MCAVTWGWNTGTAACCPCGCVSISMVSGAWSFAPLTNKNTKQNTQLAKNQTQYKPRNNRQPTYRKTKSWRPVAATVLSFSWTGSYSMPEDLTLFVRVPLRLHYSGVTRGSDNNLNKAEIMSLCFLGIPPRQLSWELLVIPTFKQHHFIMCLLRKYRAHRGERLGYGCMPQRRMLWHVA